MIISLYSRYGQRTVYGFLKDGYSALTRYYLNNFCDGTKQVGFPHFIIKIRITKLCLEIMEYQCSSFISFSKNVIAIFMIKFPPSFTSIKGFCSPKCPRPYWRHLGWVNVKSLLLITIFICDLWRHCLLKRSKFKIA